VIPVIQAPQSIGGGCGVFLLCPLCARAEKDHRGHAEKVSGPTQIA
jgi:hypothetical protein